MTVLVLSVFLLSSAFAQEVTVSGSDVTLLDMTTPSPEPVEPRRCINGRLDENNNCVCLAGWTGTLCESCVNSRLR